MPNFAIMRFKKINAMINVANSLKHCHRERETPNADPQKTPENLHMAARSSNEAMARLRELLPAKRRKDAVLVVEYVMSASPAWWAHASSEQQKAFFERSHAWLADKYGKDRIITATVHRDELTPHMSAFVVPLTQDGRLSAKEFTGGAAQLRDDQTSFAAAVGGLGLQRGIEGSRATHTRVKSFYGALNAPPVQHATIRSEDLLPQQHARQGLLEHLRLVSRVETPEEIATRLTKAVQSNYDPALDMAIKAQETVREASETRRTSEHLRNQLKPVIEALRPLSGENKELAIRSFVHAAEKLLERQREQQRVKVERLQNKEHNKGRSR